MSVKAILTEQQKSYTKAEEDALFANYYNKDYIDTYIAPLDTPTFIGTPKAPTAAAGTNTTQIATTAFVEQVKNTRVPVYGKGVNLLRNWCFVGGGTGRGILPVNQRGFTSSSGINNIYSIDGWFINGGRGEQALQSNGFYINNNSGSGNLTIQQNVDVRTANYEGKTVTLSVLVDEHLYHASNTIPQQSSSTQTVIDLSLSGTYCRLYLLPTGSSAPYLVQFLAANSSTALIQAVKLELGTEQTLAHQKNNVWVLNEAPDYEYELYRCMTSNADSSDTYANKTLATGEELAYVENGTTASRTYAVGEYFCWHGLLYRAKTAISNGATFTVNTNCEQVTGGGLNNVGFIDISSYISVFQNRLNNEKIKAKYYPGSKKIELQAEGTVATTLTATQNTLFTVTSPYAPSSGVQQFAGCGVKNSQTPVAVWANSASLNVQHGGTSTGDNIAISLSWLLI